MNKPGLRPFRQRLRSNARTLATGLKPRTKSAQDAADALRLAETKLGEAETLQRDSNVALGAARGEDHIRAESAREDLFRCLWNCKTGLLTS